MAKLVIDAYTDRPLGVALDGSIDKIETIIRNDYKDVDDSSELVLEYVSKECEFVHVLRDGENVGSFFICDVEVL